MTRPAQRQGRPTPLTTFLATAAAIVGGYIASVAAGFALFASVYSEQTGSTLELLYYLALSGGCVAVAVIVPVRTLESKRRLSTGPLSFALWVVPIVASVAVGIEGTRLSFTDWDSPYAAIVGWTWAACVLALALPRLTGEMRSRRNARSRVSLSSGEANS